MIQEEGIFNQMCISGTSLMKASIVILTALYDMPLFIWQGYPSDVHNRHPYDDLYCNMSG